MKKTVFLTGSSGNMGFESFKALYAKHNPETPHAPKIHNLLTLAKKCGLELDQDTEDKLDLITKFNISTRYEDFKQNFHKICTKDFTRTQIKVIEEFRKWLKEKLMQA